MKTRLGWIVHRSLKDIRSFHIRINRVKVDEVSLDHMLVNMYNQEFKDVNSSMKGYSEEDKEWKKKVEKSCKRIKGYFEIGLPFRNEVPMLPNNRIYAEKRLEGLKRKLLRDKLFYND